MRTALLLILALAAGGCGSKQSTDDLCLRAVKDGPPPATPECPKGTESQSALAPPSRVGRIPGPGARDEPAERRWCAGPDGVSRGPYVALDRSGQVMESGRLDASGERDGVWIIWRGAAPQAVGLYRGGASVSLEACELGGT